MKKKEVMHFDSFEDFYRFLTSKPVKKEFYKEPEKKRKKEKDEVLQTD